MADYDYDDYDDYDDDDDDLTPTTNGITRVGSYIWGQQDEVVTPPSWLAFKGTAGSVLALHNILYRFGSLPLCIPI